MSAPSFPAIPQIGRNILKAISEKAATGKPLPGWCHFVRPYAHALLSLPSIDSTYGAEDARGILLYTLSNLSGWRGKTAKATKAAIQFHLNLTKD